MLGDVHALHSGDGPHTITATYDEASTPYSSSSGTFALTVTQRPTSTVVDCQEPRTIGQGSLCNVVVSDIGSGTQSDPAGSVDFTRSGDAGTTGTFSAASCTLVSDGAATFTSACSVTYTPTAGAGTHTVRGDYNEASSAVHATSFGTDDILVTERPTSTVVDCQEPRTIGQGSLCNVVVSDIGSGTQSDPAGSVDFTRSGDAGTTGTFSAASCTLVSDGAATFTSACSVTYTPTAGAGTHTVRGDYNEASSAVHATSFGTDDILVTKRPTSTVVDCQEPRTIGQGSLCNVVVSDIGSGTQSNPAGSVDFTRSGDAGTTGTFSAASCTLARTARPPSRALAGRLHPDRRCGHAHRPGRLHEASSAVHATSFGTDDILVTKRDTETTVTCAPASVTINQGTVCTAKVDDVDVGQRSNPTGDVNFSSDGTGTFSSPSCTLAPIAADTDSSSCQVGYRPTAGAGTHNVTGAYQGSTLHESSQDAFPLEVTKRDTETTVTCAPASVTINQGTVCTAKVDDVDVGQRSNPTGDVNFSSDGTGTFSSPSCTLAPIAADTDSSSCQVGYRPTAGAGTHNVTGAYQGSTLHESSQDAFPLEVTKRDTETTVTCAPASVTINQGTVCTAKVDDVDVGQRSNPTGDVNFSSDGTGTFSSPSCTLAPIAADTDSSSCQVGYRPTAGAGTHNVTGAYQGSTLHESSQDAFPLEVTKRDTETTVTCAPASVTINQGTVCTAKVDDVDVGQRSNPTGDVNFSSDGTGTFSSPSCTLAPIAADTDSSSCQVGYRPTAGAGTHNVTGAYQGSTLHESSQDAFPLEVTKRDTETTVTCAPASVAINQGTVCTAKVDDVDVGQRSNPTGDVNFSSDGTGTFSSPSCTLAPIAADTDSSSCQVGYRPTAGAGTHNVTGAYQGSTLHESSQDAFPLEVTKRDTETTVTCAPASVAINQGTVCTAKVDDVDVGQKSNPTGDVNFSSDGTGTFSSPSCTLAPIAADTDSSSCQVGYRPTAGAGTHNVTGAYQGSTLHESSQDAFPLEVTKRDTETTVTCAPASVTINQGTVCTAKVDDMDVGQKSNPTGDVNFSSDGTGTFSSRLLHARSDRRGHRLLELPGGLPAHGRRGHPQRDRRLPGLDAARELAGCVPARGDQARHRDHRHLRSRLGRHQPGHGVHGQGGRRGRGPEVQPARATSSSPPTAPAPSARATCTLAPIAADTDSSSCQVGYRPTAGAGTHTMTGAYQGSALHESSQDAFPLEVTKRDTETTVTCAPASVAINQGTVCTAKVDDVDVGQRSNRTGDVNFSSDGTGTFSSRLLHARSDRRGHRLLELPGGLPAHGRRGHPQRDRRLPGLDAARELAGCVPARGVEARRPRRR